MLTGSNGPSALILMLAAGAFVCGCESRVEKADRFVRSRAEAAHVRSVPEGGSATPISEIKRGNYSAEVHWQVTTAMPVG